MAKFNPDDCKFCNNTDDVCCHEAIRTDNKAQAHVIKERKIDSLNWTLENKANDFLKDPYLVVVVWRGFLDTGRYSEGEWYVLNAVGKDEYEWQETDDVTHFAIAINPLGGGQ